jgi:hypothetical protein
MRPKFSKRGQQQVPALNRTKTLYVELVDLWGTGARPAIFGISQSNLRLDFDYVSSNS